MRKAWLGFVRNVLKNMDLTEFFICNSCGQLPEVLSFDCMTLGCRKDLMKASVENPASIDTLIVDGSRFSDRVCIRDANARKLLSELCSGRRNGPIALSAHTVDQIVQRLDMGNLTSLSNFLQILYREEGCIPGPLIFALKGIAKSSSCCGLLQIGGTDPLSTMCRSIGRKFVEGDEISLIEMETVYKQAPFLGKYISTCLENVSSEELMTSCRALCGDIIRLALSPYDPADELSSARFDQDDEMKFFPNWPACRR